MGIGISGCVRNLSSEPNGFEKTPPLNLLWSKSSFRWWSLSACRFSEFAAEVLNEQIEPLIKKVLKTSHLPVKFRFVKTDFGTVPPQITNLRTHKTPEGQEAKSVIVDFDFEYLGDCNLEVSILGIHSGVRWVWHPIEREVRPSVSWPLFWRRDFQMSGRGRVVLKPTTKSLPLVGGLQLCFLEPPAINFDLEGIADLCDWPILRRKVSPPLLQPWPMRLTSTSLLDYF